MTGVLRWLCPCQCAAIVRVYADGAPLDGPYVWCITVVADGDDAVMHGTLNAPSGEAFKATEEALRQAGFRRYTYDHNGEVVISNLYGRRKSTVWPGIPVLPQV